MFEQFQQYGVVPVVAVETVDQGMRLCEALLEGGLPVAEITFRTKAAEEVLQQSNRRFPEMKLGAGTLLTKDELLRARDAGATFGVAPGSNPEVIQAALAEDFPFSPGICTASEIEKAYQMGLTELKFFPAEAAGGVKMLKALSGPYGHLGLQFYPTGGINADNLLDYLSLPNVPAVGGSWLVHKSLIKDENWERITELTKEAVQLVQSQNA